MESTITGNCFSHSGYLQRITIIVSEANVRFSSKQWLIPKIIGAGAHQFKNCTDTIRIFIFLYYRISLHQVITKEVYIFKEL